MLGKLLASDSTLDTLEVVRLAVGLELAVLWVTAFSLYFVNCVGLLLIVFTILAW